MTTVTYSFHPRPSEVHLRRYALAMLVGMLLSLLLVMLLRTFASGPAVSAVADAPAPAFVAYALGRLPQAAPLLAAPDPKAALAALLPAGSRVDVGGRVVGRGRGAGMLWVSATIEGVTVYGFMPPATLRVEAGEAPPLDLQGVALTALLSPDAGVRTVALPAPPAAVGGDASAADVGVDVSVEALGALAVRDGAVGASEGGAVEGLAPSSIEIAWLPDTIAPWRGLLEAAGARHGVDPELLAIIALVESGGDPGARSGAGAMGLMQVMPGTAGDIARWRGIQGFRTAALHEPAVSIDFGAWYLARQLAAFGLADDPDWRTSVARAAAAYNGGPGSVSAWLKGRALPAEAERYHGYVSGMWAERRDASSPALNRWLRAGGQRLVTAAAQRQADLAIAEAWPGSGAGDALSAGARTAALAAGAVAVTGAGGGTP
jgi:Ni/Co efflux regulator RcnB